MITFPKTSGKKQFNDLSAKEARTFMQSPQNQILRRLLFLIKIPLLRQRSNIKTDSNTSIFVLQNILKYTVKSPRLYKTRYFILCLYFAVCSCTNTIIFSDDTAEIASIPITNNSFMKSTWGIKVLNGHKILDAQMT